MRAAIKHNQLTPVQLLSKDRPVAACQLGIRDDSIRCAVIGVGRGGGGGVVWKGPVEREVQPKLPGGEGWTGSVGGGGGGGGEGEWGRLRGGGGLKISRLRTVLHTMKLSPPNSFGELHT